MYEGGSLNPPPSPDRVKRRDIGYLANKLQLGPFLILVDLNGAEGAFLENSGEIF